MGKFIDITGQRFGRLVVIRRVENPSVGHARWHCECQCGTGRVFFGYSLRSGESISCGCWKREKIAKARTKHGCHRRNVPIMPEYNVWKTMRQRCLNPKNPSYPNYGGRGIIICERWNHFENFLADMGSRPTSTSTIERKNVNGHYCQGNCMWIEKRFQGRNTRRNRLLTMGGQTKLLCEWTQETGIGHTTILVRLKAGWLIEDALTIPPVVGRNRH